MSWNSVESSELDFNGNEKEIRITENDLQTLIESGELRISVTNGNYNDNKTLKVIESKNGGDAPDSV